MSISENIKRARKNAGLTQKQLADAIGVYPKDVSRWERGERTPAADYIKKICITLKLSADDLLEIKF